LKQKFPPVVGEYVLMFWETSASHATIVAYFALKASLSNGVQYTGQWEIHR